MPGAAIAVLDGHLLSMKNHLSQQLPRLVLKQNTQTTAFQPINHLRIYNTTTYTVMPIHFFVRKSGSCRLSYEALINQQPWACWTPSTPEPTSKSRSTLKQVTLPFDGQRPKCIVAQCHCNIFKISWVSIVFTIKLQILQLTLEQSSAHTMPPY